MCDSAQNEICPFCVISSDLPFKLLDVTNLVETINNRTLPVLLS